LRMRHANSLFSGSNVSLNTLDCVFISNSKTCPIFYKTTIP
jgi:hypothetical protein